ncbi:MAG: TetR/AcrR family transcriptional regulator [Actinomycetes bacterium]
MLPTAGAPGAHPESIGVDCPATADKVGRGAGRDVAICDAALALLAEVGYDRMSMDAVAARARASKATIYRRWAGKRELVLDAVRSRSPAAMAPPDTGSLRGDIIATLRLMAEGIGGEDAELMAGVLRAMRSTPELGDCVRTQILEGKRYIGRTLVERAVARGELPPDADPGVWHEVAPALMFFRILVTDGAVDDAFLTHVADDVLVPLLVRSGQATVLQETT